MALKAVSANVGGGGGGGTIDVAANSIIGNSGTVTQPGTSITVGDALVMPGGPFYDTTRNELVTGGVQTYYLTAQQDITGITDGGGNPYYTAARVPNASLSHNFTASLAATTDTVVGNFVTSPGDPGADAFQLSDLQNLLYPFVSGGVCTFKVRVLKRAEDGTENSLTTSDVSANFSATSVTSIKVTGRKTATSSMLPSDRLVIRILATRVSGPDPITATLVVDTTNNRPTAQSAATGASALYSLSPMDFGAKGDMLSLADGVMVASSATLTSASMVSLYGGFTANMIGRAIEVSYTPGVAPSGGLIASVPVENGGTIVVSGFTATATTGVAYLTAATAPSPDIPATGNYIPGVDLLTLQGGTFSTAAIVLVTNTTVRDGSAAVVNSGSLGEDGSVLLASNAGTGSPFLIRGTVQSGTLDAASISIFSGGVFSTNPGTLSAVPMVSFGGSNPITGVTISVAMDVRTVAPTGAGTNQGSYTVIPDDPILTAAASSSGATGAVLNGSWGTSGRTLFGTDDGPAIVKTVNAAARLVAAGGRAAIIWPARNFMFASGAMPLLTVPIAMIGPGMEDMGVYFAEGNTSAHAFGVSETLGNSVAYTSYGPNTLVSQIKRGTYISGMGFYANRDASNKLYGIIAYDRNNGFNLNDVLLDSFANTAIGTGILSGTVANSTVAYTQEFAWTGQIRTRTCGAAGKPAVLMSSRGLGGPTNDWYIQNLEVVFPLDIGLQFVSYGFNNADTADKFGHIDKMRIEVQGGNPGGSTGNLLQFGAFDSTDDVGLIDIDMLEIISPPVNLNGIAFLGSSVASSPRDINIKRVDILGGGAFGTGVNFAAGRRINVNFGRMLARTANIAVGASSLFPRNGIVGSGSTTGNLVLDATASATTDKYTGNAAILTSIATGTATFAAGVMTVSSAVTTAGQFRVGSFISTSPRGPGYGTVITSLGTGTGGNGTYNVSHTGTLSSRAVTATLSVTRQGLGYNGGTKTLTIGAIQGSSATWPWAPVAGELFSLESLLAPGDIRINAGGDEVDFTYSIGTNSSNILRNTPYATGTPGGPQTIAGDFDFTDGLDVAGVPVRNEWSISVPWSPSGLIAVGDTIPVARMPFAGALQFAKGSFVTGTETLTVAAKIASAGSLNSGTNITGLSAFAFSGTAETTGTATAANTFTQGQYLVIAPTGTITAGGILTFTGTRTS